MYYIDTMSIPYTIPYIIFITRLYMYIHPCYYRYMEAHTYTHNRHYRTHTNSKQGTHTSTKRIAMGIVAFALLANIVIASAPYQALVSLLS